MRDLSIRALQALTLSWTHHCLTRQPLKGQVILLHNAEQYLKAVG